MDYSTFISRSDQETIRVDCRMLIEIAEKLMANGPESDLFYIGAEINGRAKEIIRKLPPI